MLRNGRGRGAGREARPWFRPCESRVSTGAGPEEGGMLAPPYGQCTNMDGTISDTAWGRIFGGTAKNGGTRHLARTISQSR